MNVKETNLELSMCLLDWIDKDKIHWSCLSENPSAMDLLKAQFILSLSLSIQSSKRIGNSTFIVGNICLFLRLFLRSLFLLINYFFSYLQYF